MSRQERQQDNFLFYFMIAFFIASLIRTEFIPVFAFFIGVILGRLKNNEKWVRLK